MAWRIFAWIEQELIELLSKGLELVAEDIVDGPSTKQSFLRKLPLQEWGFDHLPAVPYWADERGDPDLKHVLATLVKLNARGQEGLPTAYHGLSNTYTIDGQTHDAYEFLYALPRPDSNDDPPKGTPPPNLLTLDDPREFTLSWTNYEHVYKDSQDLIDPFVDTLEHKEAATERFWPTIANFGVGYNLLVLAKVDVERAGALERELGDAWIDQELGAAHAAGLLYEIDMSVLDSVGTYKALDGSTRFVPGTLTLLTQDPKSKALTPVWIKVWTEHGPSHAYTREDNAWLYALQAAKASITVWGIWLGHVYHWHIVTAAMQMAMYNHLPAGHRLYPLLKPQSQNLIDFDYVLMTQLWGQISPPTPVAGYMPLLRLLEKFASAGGGRTFFDDDPHAELESHGLDEKDFTLVTPWDAYPVAGYLIEIWKITGEYVSAVVHDIYASDGEVEHDTDLQEWMKACGEREHGNVRGVPHPVTTRDLLAKILTSILYRVTVHGAGSLNPAVNPVLSFVANYPPCLQRDDIPHPDEDVSNELLGYLPHTGTIGAMATFYFTFAYSEPYERLIPSSGIKSDLYFSGDQKSCNDALYAYRSAISAFVDRYLVAWNEALEEIRGKPGAPPAYAENQQGLWPLSIEI